jgi:hypothetical protein
MKLVGIQHVREVRYTEEYKYCYGKRGGKRPLENLGIDGRII